MKKYTTPEIEKIECSKSDVITTSDTLATLPPVDSGEGEWYNI